MTLNQSLQKSNSLTNFNHPESFLFKNKLTNKRLLKHVVEKLDNSIWNETKSKYLELFNHEQELVDSGGDGYSGIFDDELKAIMSELEQHLGLIHDEIDDMIQQCFFEYEKSLVQDLSIVDGERKYKWVDPFYINAEGNVARSTSFEELYILEDFYKLLGGEFWKPKHAPLIW